MLSELSGTAGAVAANARDTRVRDDAERRLWRHPYLALRRVTCDVQDGLLTLKGCLPSYFLKQVAQAAVAETVGVERVENQIEVVACGRND